MSLTAADLTVLGGAFAAGCAFLYVLIRTIEGRFLHLPQVKRARQVESLTTRVADIDKVLKELAYNPQSVEFKTTLEQALRDIGKLRDEVAQMRVEIASTKAVATHFPEQF